MTSTTVPIKLKKEIIEKIDYLVKMGRYPNRSVAIRQILEEKLSLENYIFEDFILIKEKIKPMLNKAMEIPDLNIKLKSKKSATELVSEGRER
ncbi:MAG: ribbon-helix-helix domain-containing protein [Candidatus Helarchaeota archaeon]